MIVIRFKVKCQPDKTDELRRAFEVVLAPSRAVDGVITFDIAQPLDDDDGFIATEVFENPAARERQEALPEVAKVLEMLPGCLAAPPEATVFHVSSSEPALRPPADAATHRLWGSAIADRVLVGGGRPSRDRD